MLASWVLTGFPSVYYIGSNTALVPYCGILSGLMVVMIPAIFDMSAALYLLVKILWENGFDLESIFIYLAYGAELEINPAFGHPSGL